MALGEKRHLCGPPRATNKALGFFSFLYLPLFFVPIRLTWFSQRWAGWTQALQPPKAFPPSALNSLMGQLGRPRVRVLVWGPLAQADCSGSLRLTASQHWTDRRAKRATCYLAQTRPRELTIESLFFVSSQYFFLKNKYKKKKKADHSLLKQPDLDNICNFVHKNIHHWSCAYKSHFQSSCKGSYKGTQGHTAQSHSFHHRVTSHYTSNKLSCVSSSHLYNSINYTRNIGSLNKNIFNSLELLRQEHFHSHAQLNNWSATHNIGTKRGRRGTFLCFFFSFLFLS